MKPRGNGEDEELTLAERERRFQEMLRQPPPMAKPRMMAIETSLGMFRAIQRNPASLRLWATDPETGVEVAERPYAAKGGTAALLGELDERTIYGVMKR
jgi:hypothetical protein